jgi:predicted DNA-binding helix-hairpin-helix protein
MGNIFKIKLLRKEDSLGKFAGVIFSNTNPNTLGRRINLNYWRTSEYCPYSKGYYCSENVSTIKKAKESEIINTHLNFYEEKYIENLISRNIWYIVENNIK